MALKLWLPLNEDLHNQGISNVTTINVPSGVAIDNTGKIGKCYTSSGSATGVTTGFNFEASQFSIAAWVRINTRVNAWRCPFKLANSSSADKYQYIGFCCEHNTQTTSIGFHFYKTIDGTNTSIFDAYPITDMTVGQWTHLVVTYDGKVATYYKNGTKVSSTTVAAAKQNTVADIDRIIMLGSDGGRGGAAVKSSLNDIRIYDNCLSAAEVKEIAQGLVLHYKLDNNGQGGRNLMRKGTGTFHNTDKLTTITWSGWDSYNSLPLTDIDWNSHYGNYITYSCYMENIEQTAGTGSGIMLHFRYADGTYQQFGGGKNGTSGQYLAQGESGWLRLTVAIPNASTRSNPTTIARVEASVRHNSSGGASTIRYQYPQVEYGNKQTAWSWAPEDIGDDPVRIEDSSGYNHNGTLTGTAAVTSETPRYNVSTHFSATNQYIHVSTLTTSGFGSTYTFAWWEKRATYSNTMAWGFQNGIRLNGLYNGNLWNTGDGNNNPLYKPGTTTAVTAPTTNVWHHFAMVADGSTCKVYQDGELWAQAKTFKQISGTNLYINGWDTGSSYKNSDMSISDFRIYCTPLLDTDIKQLYNVGMKVDKLGNMHPFELQENNGMMVNAKFVNNSATSVSYDEAIDTYTIVSPVGTSSWGYGVRLADAPALMVPYGATYRWTAEVWTPVALNINTDYNNTAGGTDINWAGNDNDATGTRLTAGVAIPANKWTRIYRGASNTNGGNTNHLSIRDYSSLGLVTNGQSNSVTWKVRHLQWYIADTGFKPQIKRTGIFEASHFTEVEEDLNKPAQLHKKMLSVNATQFIER